MAYYSIFPEKDTTIYSHPDRINMNAGRDEILELVEEKATTGDIYYASRILIKFPVFHKHQPPNFNFKQRGVGYGQS